MTKLEKKNMDEPFLEEENIDKENQEIENLEEKTKNNEEPKTLESLEEKIKNSEEKFLRLLAETENQRRRFDKEKKEAYEYGGYNFAKESIAILDNFDRALKTFVNDDNLKNNDGVVKIIEGIEIIKKDIEVIFKKNGIEAIECINKKFDPNFHQAMLEIEDDSKEVGIVIEEVQKGYMMKERLLRPSFVAVTKKKDIKEDNLEKKEQNNDKKE